MIKTQVVKLKVNKTMQKHLDALCDYRRYCWNKGLETWQLIGDEKITLQGNKKHGTKHNEYVCYECGYSNDRDENAVLNLLALAK